VLNDARVEGLPTGVALGTRRRRGRGRLEDSRLPKGGAVKSLDSGPAHEFLSGEALEKIAGEVREFFVSQVVVRVKTNEEPQPTYY
jgi:hypothetical protein